MVEKKRENIEAWFAVVVLVALIGFCIAAWGIYAAGTAMCTFVAEYLKSLAYY